MQQTRVRVIALRFGNIGEVAENASRGGGFAQVLPSAKGFCAPFLCRAIVPQQQFGNGQSVELGGEGRPVSLLAGERQVFLRYLERRREVTLAVTEGSSDAECPHPHCRAAAG